MKMTLTLRIVIIILNNNKKNSSRKNKFKGKLKQMTASNNEKSLVTNEERRETKVAPQTIDQNKNKYGLALSKISFSVAFEIAKYILGDRIRFMETNDTIA